jgi:hypothetical protein
VGYDPDVETAGQAPSYLTVRGDYYLWYMKVPGRPAVPYGVFTSEPPPEAVGMYSISVDNNLASRSLYELQRAGSRIQEELDRRGIPLP